MNALGILLAWGAVQVSLFALFGVVCYLMVRRRGPSAGALVALSALVLLLVVPALAVSPWPRWWTAGESRLSVLSAPNVPNAGESSTPSPDSDTESFAPIVEIEPEGSASRASWQTAMAAFGDALWEDLKEPAPVSRRSGWRWPTILGALILAGGVFGFARLCLGLMAVRGYRTKSIAVEDAELVAEVAGLCQQMGCRRLIELRMSDELTSPATVGWRNPLVIVPAGWRTWSCTERRVALAHELAHVCRGDYASSVLAQVSLAMNFYHPVVHWLARRLRFEQELAADTIAATTIGSREEYLLTLAQLTLRYDDQRVAWAARSFLPTRGIFLRRIEMLRDPKQWLQRPLSRVAKVCLVTLLAAAGLLASGLRGPIGNVVQSASAAPVDVNASRASGEVSRAEVGLQDLVTRAKDKSVVNIPAGTYSSTLTIDRAMTLKGENAEKCIVEVTADAPAISVATPKPVILDSLTIRWQLATSDSQQGAACAVFLKDAAVTLRNCRIIAAGGSKRCPSAVQAVGFSKVTIENCRFEGFDFTVSYSGGAEGTITDSVFIQPGHCGITVMEGSKLNVARNIITRSEYHGLRSTGGTVIARDNLIVSNKNRGVYLGNRSAHGKLTNNVLLDNATGISAFGQSDVTIENNLILDSGYAGLDTRDSCAIGVRNNLFQGNPRGLVLVAESGKSKVKIGRNSFWENQTNVENFELPKGSIFIDPQLTAPKEGDFTARAEEIVKYKQGLSNPKVFTALWEKWQQISKETAQ